MSEEKKTELEMGADGRPQIKREATALEVLASEVGAAINFASDYGMQEYTISGIVLCHLTGQSLGATTETERTLVNGLREAERKAIEGGMTKQDAKGVLIGTMFGAMFAFRAAMLAQQQMLAMGAMQEQGEDAEAPADESPQQPEG